VFIKVLVLYNTMETKEILCPKCNSKEIIKRGLIKTENRDSTQRYGCKNCNNRFVLDNPFYGMKNNQLMITQCTDLYYSGMSFRKIADHLKRFFPRGVNHSTIYRWIMKYVGVMANFTDKQKTQLGQELECDEVEYHRLGKKNWFVESIDTKTRYITYSKYIEERNTKELIKFYKKVKVRSRGQTKVICTDGLVSYPRVLRKTWGLNKHATRNPKVIHKITIGSSGSFNYKIERFHNTLRERTKVMRGFHGSVNSAQTLLKGFEIYYNWIRNHQSLEGQTPSEIACPNVQIENKNGWLELIQRGYNGK